MNTSPLTCKECGNSLSGQQLKYCSPRCMRRYVAREWKKNNHDKIREYNRRHTAARRARLAKPQEKSEPVDNAPSPAPNRHCRNCANELTRHQKVYCSIKCYQDWGVKYRAETDEHDLRFQVNWTPERRDMTQTMRDKALEIKTHKCLRCGTTDKAEVHHIRPKNRDGSSDISNLMILCRECHDLWHKVFPDDLFWNNK